MEDCFSINVINGEIISIENSILEDLRTNPNDYELKRMVQQTMV
jgi:hypothetical protein